ncbi:MAG: MFS transporter [Pseudolabrys sp.]|nr:MFS transporter [Pseudolabrys sp.]
MKLSDFTRAGTSPLDDTAAIVAVAMMIGIAFAGSTLVTPLYVIYEEAFGFSRVMLTLIYASYVIGNLGALLFFGGVSDQIGRRRTALPAMGVCALSAVVFLLAHHVAELFVARVLIGLGVGVAAGTGTAWLAELVGKQDKSEATIIATSSNFLGIAGGPLLAGFLADYAPWPLHLPFAAYLAVVVITALLIARTRETVTRARPLAAIAIAPKLGVPADIRAPFIAPAVTGAGAMALIGFYAALAPSILAENLHQKSHLLAGALVFEIGVAVALSIVLTRRLKSRAAMLWSLGLMIPSVAMVVAAQAFGSMALILLGTALCGITSGLGYRGSLQVVNQIAPPARRAEVLSVYFICCFSGNALPVIGVGIITVWAGAIAASMTFAAMIALFAAVALGFGLKYRV